MKKKLLSFLVTLTMVLSLMPASVFADGGRVYNITNGSPETDQKTNHGYIEIDKTTAAAIETVSVTVVPDEGYQLKSLTVTPAFTVAFDLNGINGTAPKAQEVAKDGKVTKPTDPKDTDYTFAGWYKTKDATTDELSDPWDFDNDTVTADMTLYAQWTSECIAAGTMISMPGGKQKKVEDLEIGDIICTFDHETGEVSSAPVAFIWESKNVGNAFTLTFEGDIEVTVIEEHGFYDQEEQKYVFINLQNAEEYKGHHFYNADTNSWLALKSCEALNDSVDAYAIITSGDLNHMSNGMLSMCDGTVKVFANMFDYDDQMKFDADKKNADIEAYGLTTKEKILELEGFIESDYDDYNLQYLNVAIGKGLTTWERIEALSDYFVANGLVDIYSCSETAEENEAPKMLLMSATTPKNLLGSALKSAPQDGIIITANGTYQFTMPGYAVIVTAEFEEVPAPAHTHNDITFTAWKDAAKLPGSEGNYYLDTDVTLDKTWAVPGTTNLCLNGHVIKLTEGKTGSVISVVSGATLNLYDCDTTTEHKFKADDTGLWKLDSTGDKTVTGGVITGGNASSTLNRFKIGGGINVSGTFTMNGGNIVGNTASDYGGGVYVKDGSFTMYGGMVAGNTASQGGGVYADSTSVTLGGTVKIIENFRANNSADNFYVVGKNPIKSFSLGVGDNAPKAGMHVGIKMQKSSGGEFTTNATATQVGCFTPDDSTFGVRLSSTSGIELAKLYAITTDGITNGTITTDATENKAFAGDPMTITVTPSTGYQLKANTLKAVYDDGEEKICELTPGAGNTYTFTMPAYAVTVSAEFERIPTPSSGGSSSSTVTVPVTGDENTVKVSAKISGNTATVKEIKDADLEKVTEGESVSIDLSAVGKNINTAKIPTETVEKIAEKSSMTVKLPAATVEFDKTATEEITDQAKGSNIELVVDEIKEVSLNAVQKEAVKTLDTAVIIDAHLASGGTKLCTEDNGGFGGGSAKVILPYEIKKNRAPENYSVFYVAEDGKLEKLSAVYDKELKAFVFEITHFSVYAVTYDEFVNPFTDVAETAYYYDAVKWAAANGITSGKTLTTFAPNDTCTRAEFVTFLWRAAGQPVVNYAMPFTDVPADKFYTEAVRWATSEGIVKGTTDTTFSPNALVNRGQAVAFLYRYSKAPALMNMTANGPAPSPFSDVANTSYCYQAVLWAVKQGITDGVTDTTFAPTADCPRAQVVCFLYRYFVK